MRLHHLVSSSWLRFVKLFDKPPLVLVVETWLVLFLALERINICDKFLSIV